MKEQIAQKDNELAMVNEQVGKFSFKKKYSFKLKI